MDPDAPPPVTLSPPLVARSADEIAMDVLSKFSSPRTKPELFQPTMQASSNMPLSEDGVGKAAPPKHAVTLDPKKKKVKKMPQGDAFFLISPTNHVRVAFFNLVTSDVSNKKVGFIIQTLFLIFVFFAFFRLLRHSF
jgi:hypothetical protein